MADEIIFQLKFEADDSALGAFEKRIEKLKKDFSKGFSGGDNFQKLQKEFRDLAMAGEEFSKKFAKMIDQVEKSMQIKPTFFEKFKTAFSSGFKTVLSTAKTIGEKIGGYITQGLSAASDKIKSSFKNVFSGVMGWLDSFIKNGIVSIFSGIGGLIKNALSGVGEIVSSTLENSFNKYVEFEDILTVARRTMSLTAEDADKLGRSMRNLSLEVRGSTAEDMTKIAGIAGNLGINFKDGEENLRTFVKAIAQIGIATDLTVEQAAAQIPSILAQYKVASKDMGATTESFGNVLNRLGNNMNATQSQILKVAATMSGTAATSGITAEKLLGISAAVASIDKRLGTAGGNVSQILNKLISDSGTWAETLGLDAQKLLIAIRDNPVKALEMVIDRMSQLQQTEPIDIFQAKIEELGLRGFRTGEEMKKLVLAKDELGKAMALVSDEMEKQNSLQIEANIAAERFSALWTTLVNAVNEVYRVIGQPLVEALSAILDQSILPLVQEFVQWFNSSEEIQTALTAIKEGIIKIATETIGPLLQEFVEWITSSEEVQDILSNKIPEGMRKLELLALSVVGHFKDFRAYLQEGYSVWEALVATFPELERFDGNIQQIMQSFDEVTAMFGVGEIKFDGMIEAFLIGIDAFLSSWKSAVDFFQPGMDMLVSGFYVIVDVIKGDMTRAFQSLTDVIQAFFETFLGFIPDVSDMFDMMNAKANDMFQNMMRWIKGIPSPDEVAKGASGGWGEATTAINDTQQAVKQYKNELDDASKALTEHERIGTGNSTWPEAKAAIKETEQVVDDYTKSLIKSTGMLGAQSKIIAGIDPNRPKKYTRTDVDGIPTFTIGKDSDIDKVVKKGVTTLSNVSDNAAKAVKNYDETVVDGVRTFSNMNEKYQKEIQKGSKSMSAMNRTIEDSNPFESLVSTVDNGGANMATSMRQVGGVIRQAGGAISQAAQTVTNEIIQRSQAAFGAIEQTRRANAVELSRATPISPLAIQQRQTTIRTSTTSSTQPTVQPRVASEGMGVARPTTVQPRVASEGVSVARPATIVNNNFNGMNVIDQNSYKRVAREIGKTQQKIDNRTVRA